MRGRGAAPRCLVLLCAAALATSVAPLTLSLPYFRLRGGSSAESDVEGSDSFLELLPQPRGTGPPERPENSIELAGRDPIRGVGDEDSAPAGRIGKRRHLPLDKWVEDGLGDDEHNYEETLDHDWSPGSSETLSGSSGVLSDSISGAATTSEVAQTMHTSNTSVLNKSTVKDSSVMRAAEGLSLAHDHGDGGLGTASGNTERKKCAGARVVRAIPPAGDSGLAAGCMAAGVDEMAGSGASPGGWRMERHSVVAALLKFRHGRPWLPQVLGDAGASLDSLVALHRHILDSEHQRLAAAADASPSHTAAAAEDTSPHVFIKSDEYLGVRRGMLFREGHRGLGYYEWPCADKKAGSSEHLRRPCALFASAHGNAHRPAKVAVLEMVDDDEAGQWELDARFVGQQRALLSRKALRNKVNGTHGPDQQDQSQQATETGSEAAGDADTDRRDCPALVERALRSDAEKDALSQGLDGAVWHDRMTRQMDLQGAARAAALRQHHDSTPLPKFEPQLHPHEKSASEGRRRAAAGAGVACAGHAVQQDVGDVDPFLATSGSHHASDWDALSRDKAIDARVGTPAFHRGEEGAGAFRCWAWGEGPGLADSDTTLDPKDGFDLDVADQSVEDMLVQVSQGMHVAPRGATLRLQPPPGGWRDDDPNILRISLEEEEEDLSGEGSGGGRVWMSPGEIAEANGQSPPRVFDHLPTQAVLFNSSEIIAQSKRETCPCRWHPSECMACRGVPRVILPESDVDESWPEITRHEFRKRFPHVAEPTWPADDGVYVADSDLVWWTPWLSA